MKTIRYAFTFALLLMAIACGGPEGLDDWQSDQHNLIINDVEDSDGPGSGPRTDVACEDRNGTIETRSCGNSVLICKCDVTLTNCRQSPTGDCTCDAQNSSTVPYDCRRR